MRPLVKCSMLASLAWLIHSSSVMAADLVQIDFVQDRAFPPSQAEKKKKREYAESMTFNVNGLVVVVTGENEFGGAVEVARRGPGGLGVKGNGDRNAAGKGTTSGNRVNNGESLVIRFMNNQKEPTPVTIKSVVIDRIVRDTQHFSEVGVTKYALISGHQTIVTGELPTEAGSTKGGPARIAVEMSEPTNELRMTNGAPFHPIANRFRVSAISIVPEK